MALATILPSSLMAGDSGAGMLYSKGGVFLNGTLAPPSSALFPNDLVQTKKDSVAQIEAKGSTVTVQPETIAQYQDDELHLEHGSLQVNTSTQFRVRVGCLIVIPVTAEWTQYDVIDLDGKVTVAARKSDVRIETRVAGLHHEGRGDTVTVHEGEQKTRDERCAAATASPVNATGAILNSAVAKWSGAAVVAVLTCWALCRGDNPISPSSPSK